MGQVNSFGPALGIVWLESVANETACGGNVAIDVFRVEQPDTTFGYRKQFSGDGRLPAAVEFVKVGLVVFPILMERKVKVEGTEVFDLIDEKTGFDGFAVFEIAVEVDALSVFTAAEQQAAWIEGGEDCPFELMVKAVGRKVLENGKRPCGLVPVNTCRKENPWCLGVGGGTVGK